jgi:hypothetical protein
MEVRDLQYARGQRPGVGIGRGKQFAAIKIEELRRLVALSDFDPEQWESELGVWWGRDEELRERGWVPRVDGRLRVRLPRRYDRPPHGEAGWRFSFTDQVGRPLESQLDEIVQAFWERAARDAV